MTGLVGGVSKLYTVVAWYGLSRITLPKAVVTTIEPELSPFSSGKSIIRLESSSVTVIVKSVPLIPIVAEFVFIEIFSFGMRGFLLEIKRPVPLTKLSAILDLLGLGSNTNLSITTLECSVKRIVVSSLNITPILPLLVSRRSIALSEKSITLSYGLSLTTLVLPFSSVILPISTACASTLV